MSVWEPGWKSDAEFDISLFASLKVQRCRVLGGIYETITKSVFSRYHHMHTNRWVTACHNCIRVLVDLLDHSLIQLPWRQR